MTPTKCRVFTEAELAFGKRWRSDCTLPGVVGGVAMLVCSVRVGRWKAVWNGVIQIFFQILLKSEGNVYKSCVVVMLFKRSLCCYACYCLWCYAAMALCCVMVLCLP